MLSVCLVLFDFTALLCQVVEICICRSVSACQHVNKFMIRLIFYSNLVSFIYLAFTVWSAFCAASQYFSHEGSARPRCIHYLKLCCDIDADIEGKLESKVK